MPVPPDAHSVLVAPIAQVNDNLYLHKQSIEEEIANLKRQMLQNEGMMS